MILVTSRFPVEAIRPGRHYVITVESGDNDTARAIIRQATDAGEPVLFEAGGAAFAKTQTGRSARRRLHEELSPGDIVLTRLRGRGWMIFRLQGNGKTENNGSVDQD